MSGRLISAISMIGLVLCASVEAHADPSPKDIQVMSKTLGFVHLPAGSAKIALAYDPANPASKQAADTLKSLMGDNFKAGPTILSVILVPLSDLGKTADIGVFYAVDGLGASASAVEDAAKARQAPCLTDDIDLVRGGNCAIGVKSDPKLQILVNRKVTEASGLSFDPAFTMLVTEI